MCDIHIPSSFLISDAEGNATELDDSNVTSKANDTPPIYDMQSDLIAPASGPKPLQAKYTIRILPKLRDGVPQVQEIRIMPPKGNDTKAFVKPLMVLKQNVSRPMIENIEIDVPEKGKKFSSKPSVEVIEGDHRETLQVSKGEAVIENPEQRSHDYSAGMASCSNDIIFHFLPLIQFIHSLRKVRSDPRTINWTI